MMHGLVGKSRNEHVSLLKPTCGTAFFFDLDVARYSEKQINSQIDPGNRASRQEAPVLSATRQ